MIKILKNNAINLKMDVTTEFEEHRFKTFFEKEPETIDWIKTLMRPNEVFFDIGANIGVYSLFANAFYRDNIKTYAFEPAFHNFEKLCKNTVINDFHNLIPCCVAISDKTKFEIMKLSSDISGSASHIFANAPEHLSKNFVSKFDQGVFGVSLDDLVKNFNFPCPNHIKIDTDGFEEGVLAGAAKVLYDVNLKSILIEITDINGARERIINIMTAAGFKQDHAINFQTNHSRERRRKNSKDCVENIIFTR